METGFIRTNKKFYSVIFIISLLLSICITAHVRAEVTGPGWFDVKADPVSPADARAYYSSKQGRIVTQGIADSAVIAQATSVSDEVNELARALQYDPLLIYDYVLNHIDYVPYFGSLKGATATLLDRAGNDFDQASLLIALLEESKVQGAGIGTIQYVYGQMTIPNFSTVNDYDLEHWLGISASTSVIGTVLGSGGIPATIGAWDTTLDRVWVKANIGGTDYMLDPAFKKYNVTTGIDLASAMGYDRASLLAAAGGTQGTDYIQNLNDAGLRSALDSYTSALTAILRSNYPNADTGQIIGSKTIIPETVTQLPTSMRFPYAGEVYWTTIPSQYEHTVRIQHGQIDQTFPIHDIAGKRLAITYDTGGAASAAAGSSPGIQDSAPQLQGITNFTQTELNISNPVITVPALEGAGKVTIQSTSTWDFGRINSYGSVTYSTTYNIPSGYPTATFNSWLSNNGSGAYTCTQNCGVQYVGAGQSITIKVTFSGSGQSRGTKTATLNVNISGSGYTPSTDYYYCTGFKAADPDFTGSYGMNFGQRYLDDPADGTAKLKNNGSYTVTINGMRWTGSGSSQFQFLSGNGTGNLGAGQTRDINIRYLASAVGVHNADIEIEFSYDGLTYNYPGVTLPNVGETISAPPAQLWLEDTIIAEEITPVSGAGLTDLTLTIDHPYTANSGTFADQTATYNLKRGANYVIISDYGDSKDGLLLKQRQRLLDDYRKSGLADSSREVLTETLNVVGQTWMQQTNLSDNLLGQLSNVYKHRHHRFGITAQEDGYYIDVKGQMSAYISRSGVSADEKACFKAGGFLGSALEHGVLEQLQGVTRPAASTIKLIYLANSQGDKIFLADSANYSSIEPQLTGYSTSGLQDFQNLVNGGSILILPENGQIDLVDWRGKGYVDFNPDMGGGLSHIGMIIGGDYYGGYGGVLGNLLVDPIYREFFPELVPSADFWRPKSIDPVDMATGAFLFEHKDLALGDAEPKGLHFTRSYNSDNHNDKTALGYGWTHSYNIYLDIHSDVYAGLGKRQPVDTAASIVSSFVTLDLMQADEPSLKEWTTSVLVNKWEMDQLFENAVSVHLKDQVLTFIKLPDGTYNSPPGITTQLVNSSGYRLEERFGTKIYFNANNKVSSWVDIDGNTMTFTYNANDTVVQDSFGRTLTLNHPGGLITSVTDSTGRSVSYGYSSDELTTYTDPDSKDWTYGYDTNHRMTSLTDPLSVTTAINAYDTIGNVMTQQVPRQNGLGVSKTVAYYFYFSDFRNAEQDPDGYTITYYFDEKGRAIGEEDQVGYKTSQEYDGQNHIIRTVDQRNNQTLFEYDGNQNLITTTDALSKITKYTYDVQLRLTDTIDPLFHGSHIDYDAEHHPITSKLGVQYDGSFTPQDNGIFQTSATYYADGLTDTTTDGRGTTTSFTYTANYGKPKTTVVGAHPAVTTDYNEIGLLTSLQDQVNATATFPQYNNRGQLKLRTDRLGKNTQYFYDDTGRLDYIIDRNNDTIDFTYTATGKAETILYPDAATVNFIYDDHDDLVQMQAPLGNTDYTYNPDHTIASVTDTNGFSVSYSYDEAGNVTEITYPGSKKIIYTYDRLNRLETVTIDWLSPKQTATYHYDDAGRLYRVDNFNGTVTDYAYDNANRLTYLENRKSDTTVIALYDFSMADGLDENGNRTHVIRQEPLSPALPSSTINYNYNDPTRNRLEGTDSIMRFTYDDEGQLSSKDADIYSFDYEHRLEGIAGTNNIQYYYDGNGNRLKAIRDGVTTKYIYDANGNLLAEADDLNNITRYYIHGLGLMAMVTPSDAVYTYHYNAVGSTMAITDGSEVIVNSYAYTPFGILANEVETIQQPFKFVGQHGIMTEPNGFYYMRARYYDTEVGRFISEDPIGFNGGDVNLYAYTANNPILLIDPLGLWYVDVGVNIPAFGPFGGVSVNVQIGPSGSMVVPGLYIGTPGASVAIVTGDPVSGPQSSMSGGYWVGGQATSTDPLTGIDSVGAGVYTPGGAVEIIQYGIPINQSSNTSQQVSNTPSGK